MSPNAKIYKSFFKKRRAGRLSAQRRKIVEKPLSFRLEFCAELFIAMFPRLPGLLILTALAASGQQYAFLPVPDSPKKVIDLFEDSRDRLWLATDGGDVFSFDGARFYSLRTLGLPAVRVSDFAEDSDGGLWMASDSGLFRYFKGAVKPYLEGRRVAQVGSVAPGVLVAAVMPKSVGPAHELYRLRRAGQTFQLERFSDRMGFVTLTVDQHGTVLTACPGGWCEFSQASIVNWRPGSTDQPTVHLDIDRANARVMRDKSGCLWYRDFAEVSHKCPGEGPPRFLPRSLNRANMSAELHEAPDGSVEWASTGLLVEGRPGNLRFALPENGLPPVECSLPARDGSIWLGGPGGLYRFASPFKLEYWTQRDGIEAPTSLMRLGNRIFAGTARGLAVLTEDRSGWRKIKSSMRLGQIASLASTERGTLLAVQLAKYVMEMDANGTVLAQSRDFGGVKVTSGKNSIWANGLYLAQVERNGSRLILHRADVPAVGSGWNVAIEPATQQVWQCNASGVGMLSNGHWRLFTRRDGLLENTCSAITPQPGGDIWVGYEDTPAFAHVSAVGRVQQYTGGGEIGDARVRTFATDSRGWLWRGGPDGIHVARTEDAERGEWMNLTGESGLPGLEPNRGSFFTDTDGSVWWGTGNAVVHYSPEGSLARPLGTPSVYVSGISVDDSIPKLIDEAVKLSSGMKLALFLGSLDFAQRNNIRVRYRLESSAPWRAVQGFYIDLARPGWGSHTVEIQSRYVGGPWSPVLRQTFLIGPPQWLNRRAALFAALALLALGVAFYIRRDERKRRAQRSGTLPSLDPWRILATSPEIGDLLDTTLDRRFRVDAVIDSGAFGAVLAGRDLKSGGRCAIKVFHRTWAEADWIAHRFDQEVSALQRVRHPNVVSILGHGKTPEGGPYLVMEFIEGNTLRKLLEGGPLPPQHVGRLLLQAGRALQAIHAQGIFHRDLKPENILLRSRAPEGEELVLIDFSIAIIKDADQSMQGRSRAAGTFYYMAPEQSVGYATPASDIHSLAKIVIEMLTAERLTMLVPKATIDLPLFIPELVKTWGLPFSEASILELCAALQFDPVGRPQHALPFTERLASDLLVKTPDVRGATCVPSPSGNAPGEP
jgi:ligand-binding sensor domain-containing protein